MNNIPSDQKLTGINTHIMVFIGKSQVSNRAES